MTTIDHKFKALLIDLDGTMYHGTRPIEGAATFISYLQEHHWKYRFVTNNSSATAEHVADRLQSMGIAAAPEDVCTSAQATAHYIMQKSTLEKQKAYVIGEEGLMTALEQCGVEITEDDPHYVIQGIDREFNYEKAARAVSLIRGGATYIMTNPDLLLPSTNGLIPGAGSIGAMLKAASGVDPIIIGKPSSILINFALDQLNVAAREALVIGDNMSTDIAAGFHAGCSTALLYTGLTNAENKAYYTEKAGCDATYIFPTIDDLHKYLAKQ